MTALLKAWLCFRRDGTDLMHGVQQRAVVHHTNGTDLTLEMGKIVAYTVQGLRRTLVE